MHFGFSFHDIGVTKTREVFKVQVGLNVDDRVLVYNRDRDRGGEFAGARAQRIISTLNMHKFGKRKTYVFGKWLPATKTIQLEQGGELPEFLWPDW